MKEDFYKGLTKVYGDLEEKFVKNVVLYAQADKKKVCIDPAFKTAVGKDDLLELLNKGVIIVMGNENFVPTSWSITSGYVTVKCAYLTAPKEFYSAEKTEL